MQCLGKQKTILEEPKLEMDPTNILHSFFELFQDCCNIYNKYYILSNPRRNGWVIREGISGLIIVKSNTSL